MFTPYPIVFPILGAAKNCGELSLSIIDGYDRSLGILRAV